MSRYLKSAQQWRRQLVNITEALNQNPGEQTRFDTAVVRGLHLCVQIIYKIYNT